MSQETNKIEDAQVVEPTVVDTKELVTKPDVEKEAKIALEQAARKREHDAAVKIDAICVEYNVTLKARLILDDNNVQFPIGVVANK